MYLLDRQVTIDWVLLASAVNISLSDLFVLTTKPDGSNEFTKPFMGAYTPATDTSNGLATSTIAPDAPGLWQVHLLLGDYNDYQVLSTAELFVFGTKVTSVTNIEVPYVPEVIPEVIPEPDPEPEDPFIPDNSGLLDLMIVLDESGSMDNWRNTEGIRCYDGPTETCKRIRTWQKEAVVATISNLPSACRVGMVKFSGTSTLLLGLTPVSTGLQSMLDIVDTLGADGSTNIGSGITEAYTEIVTNGLLGNSQQILVFSDGVPTDTNYNPVTGTWEAATQAAITAGIDYVHAVALPGASIEVMQGIATTGGGNFLDATTDLNALSELYS